MSTLKTNNIQHVDLADPSILLNSDGSVSIAGTVSYEDATNVDSVGIITGRLLVNAQKQVHVGTGVSVKAGGLNVTAGITTVQALQATTGTFSGAVSGTTGTFSGDVSIADKIIHTGDTNTAIRFPSADVISFESGGSESFRVDTSGKLLVGQTSDSDGQICMAGVLAFSAGGSGTPSGANTRPNISRGTNGQLILAAGKDAASTIRFDVAADASTNAAQVALIDSSGRLGLGVASPQATMHIEGGSEGNLLQLSNTHTGATNSDGFVMGINSSLTYLYNRENKHITFGTNNTERLRIRSDGTVDIGSGTHSRNLTVHAATNSVILIEGASNGTSNLMFGDENDEDVGMIQYNHGDNDLAFTINASERLTINSSGNAQFTGIVTTTTGQFVTPNTTGSLAARNRIDNGAMEIAQRGGAEVTINSGTEQCVCDRWFARGESGDSFLYDQDSSAPYGFKNSLKFNCANTSSGGANQIYTITQAIEGNMIADFGFGGGSARAIAVSFWVKSSLTGDFGGALQNSARNKSFNFVYNIAGADDWEYKTILVPAPTSGTWVNDTGVGLRLIFDMGCGSNFRGNAGSWLSADTRGPSGAVSPMQTSNSVWRVTGVQVEMGPAATPFEYRGFPLEMQRCHRYFQSVGAGYITAARGASSSMYLYSYCTSVAMRSTPTISTNNNIAHGTFSVRRYRDGSGVSDSTTTPATSSTYFQNNQAFIYLQQDGFSATDDRSATIFVSGGAITLSSEIS